MISLLIVALDIFIVVFLVLNIVRLIRVVFMRLKFTKNIKSICEDKQYVLQKHRSFLTSVFHKSDKIDFTVKTDDSVYRVKFIASLSSKKVYHFVDENNYITYYKMFFALPMANQTSESTHFLSYHRFPTVKKENNGDKYVLLFNPLPSDITYIDRNGSNQTAGNGSMIGDFYVYNGKGFCSLIKGDSR